MDLTSLALSVVIGGVFLYALYLVVRAAVRDGIKQAGADREATTTSKVV